MWRTVDHNNPAGGHEGCRCVASQDGKDLHIGSPFVLVDMANGLTTKQEAFILAYIGEAKFNASKAARLAGYSEKGASVEGTRLLANASVAARIADELKSRSITADGILAELTDIATADWRDFVEVAKYDRDGNPLTVKMDLSAKVKSLEVLGKAHGLLTDRIDLTGTMTQTVELVGIDPEDI